MLCMERECGSYEDFPRKHGDKLQGLGSSKVWWVYDGALEVGSTQGERDRVKFMQIVNLTTNKSSLRMTRKLKSHQINV